VTITESAPVVFIDTETDGVHPNRKPWEIALIRRDERGERETSFFVEIDLSTADPFGLRVGRFYERHPLGLWLSGSGVYEDFPEPDDEDTDYVSTQEAAHWVARLTHGAHLVGAVPNFDAETLDRLLRRHELLSGWHYHLIDIEAMAVGYLAGLRAAGAGENGRDADLPALPWDSDDLSRACGVEPPGEDERHTALGDARWAARLYDAITGSGS
jgi:hypothetical protein